MNQDQLAVLVCSCAVPLVTYNDELRGLVAAGDMGGLSQKMTQGDQIMQSSINCITEQLNKNKNNLINEKLEQLIDDQCHLDQRMVTDLLDNISSYELPIY